MIKEVCNREVCRTKTTCYRWWANVYLQAAIEALNKVEERILVRVSKDMAKTVLAITGQVREELLTDVFLWNEDEKNEC